MAEIMLLDSSTIDKIAAGEVVERPSSVVKELVENAMDAGARAVTVEIKEGGCSFIRVTDNGGGIEKEQVRKAFFRHATSKIRTVDDLYQVKSLKGYDITMMDGSVVPLSQKKSVEFREKLSSFLARQI